MDPSAAAMPGVRVTARNADTGDERISTTNEQGQFAFPSLLPGVYNVSADAAGFKKTVSPGIVVDVQQSVRADLRLEVGDAAERIEVKIEAPLLQPFSSSLGQVVDNQKILDLPLEGRNSLELVSLTAGVQPLGNFGGLPAIGNAYSQGNFSVGGGQGLSTSVIMDGTTLNGTLYNSPVFVPSVDTVGEFKVQTNGFSAEFGRTGGGVVNIAMKSGTNIYHGGVYEFFRNRALDANSFMNNTVGQAKPQYTYNLFGGTIGGPVNIPGVYTGKDRTFFFASLEGFRQRRGVNVILTVPTNLQRQGDFSQTLDPSGNQIGVYDPTTTSTVNGASIREQFPENRIPKSRFDPVAAKIMTYYPLSNLPGNPLTAIRNFISNAGSKNRYEQVNSRLDHRFGSHGVFGRYSMNRANRGTAYLAGEDNPFWGSNPGGGKAPVFMKGQQFVLRDTVARPTALYEFSYGATRMLFQKVPLSWGMPITDLGFPASLANLLPQKYYPNISVTDMSSMTASDTDLVRRGDFTHSTQASMTRMRGRNTLKAGFEYRLQRVNDYQPPAITSFSFGRGFTQQNPNKAASNSGFGVASFLLGVMSGGSSGVAPAMSVQNHYLAGYVQNDIRLTRRLTLNLGLRYEIETARTERHNQLNWFDFNTPWTLDTPSGAWDLKGGLAFAGVNGNPRRQQNTDPNNVSPRIGFAYSLSSKTVLRGGYGIFYFPLSGTGHGSDLGNGGYSASTSVLTTNDSGLTAANVLSDPFPKGLNAPVGNTAGFATLLGQSIRGVFRENRVGYAQQYNFNIQRELPFKLLLDVAYAGSHSVRIPNFLEINQLNPLLYENGNKLTNNVPNMLYGVIATGSLASKTVSRGQSLRPFPQFNDSQVLMFAGNSMYNAFQLKVEKRMTSFFGILVSYTNSKNIGDANPVSVAQGWDAFASFQNNYDRRSERSLLTTDVPQRLVTTYSYQLPFGRRHRWGHDWNRLLDGIAGGWQLNGITTFQRGTPLNMSLNTSNTYGGKRPNSTGVSAYLPDSERSMDRWFNTSVFTQPPSYSLGNVGRTLPDVRNDGVRNFDISMLKTIKFTERWKAQLRAETFNSFNRVRLGSPNGSFGSTAFGTITSAGNPRMAQVALKLNF